jgi:hypothetical protein
MNELRTRQLLVITAGLLVGIVSVQALGLFGGASPSVFAPAPFPMFLLAWFVLGVFTPLVAPAVFCLWSIQLFRGVAKIPLRTPLLFLVVVFASTAWFYVGWRYGIRYEGWTFTVTTAALSACLAVGSAVLVVNALMHPSFLKSLFAHFVLFSWLFSYAFPYLGEVP